MEKIVVIGASGHAKVVIDIIEQQGCYKIAGIIDRNRQSGEIFFGYEVLGLDTDLPVLMANHPITGAIIAIGDNYIRAEIATKIAALCPTLKFVTAIHPSAVIANNTPGEGAVVMAGAIVNPDCKLGRFTILNTNSSLDHDCVLADFASLGPRVAVGGNCSIGQYTAISIGATLIHGRQIGEHSLVGAGATVVSDIPALCVAYGTPAKEVRKRHAGEKYL